MSKIFKQRFEEADKTKIPALLEILEDHYKQFPSNLRGSFHSLKNEFINQPNLNIEDWRAKFLVWLGQLKIEISIPDSSNIQVTGNGNIVIPNTTNSHISINSNNSQNSPDKKLQKILFLAANPLAETRLQVDREHRIIKAEMERGSHRDKYEFLPPQFAVTITELLRALNDKPEIIHFSGHGIEQGIIITNDNNQRQVLPNAVLQRMFKPLQNVTKLVLLNSCHSAEQAKIISQFGIYVVGNNKPIGDSAAISFAKGLYNGLGEGKTFEEAFNDAMIVLMTEDAKYADVVEVWKDGEKLSL